MHITTSRLRSLWSSGLFGVSAMVMVWFGVISVASAQSEKNEEPADTGVFLEIEAGVEYDSLVSLDELDLSEDSADTAAIINASVGYATGLGEKTDFSVSYSYNTLTYDEFSQVDQNSHILTADLKQRVGKADIGLSSFYINSELDGEGFLELTRFSPYVAGFFAEGWFARGAFVYSDKTNELNPERDAQASIGEIDVYHFPKGKAWFVNVGYKYRDEDATAARFDYAGNTFKARYVQRFGLFDRKARFELAFRRLDRDYTSITPSIGEERFDERDRLSFTVEIAATDSLDVEAYYTYSDWQSNLDSVDFDQDIAGLRFRYRLER